MKQLFTRIKSDLWSYREQLKVMFRYWRDPTFMQIDLSLFSSYLFNSPYKMTEGDPYGETPLTTMEKIAKECDIQESDIVYDLGCGRGRSCFWLSRFIGCEVVGIDCVTPFITTANLIKERYHLKGVQFHKMRIEDADITKATVIYSYNLVDASDLIQKVSPGTKWISISEPIHHTAHTAHKQFQVDFPWGETLAYIQEVQSSPKSLDTM